MGCYVKDFLLIFDCFFGWCVFDDGGEVYGIIKVGFKFVF